MVSASASTSATLHRRDAEFSAKEKEVQEAEKEKEKGNEMYSKDDFAKAIVHYQRALDIDSENGIYWGNLSAAMFGVKAFKEVCIVYRQGQY